MPYRRLPNTDAARLRALKTLLDNSDIYTVNNRFIDWKTLGLARQFYIKLQTITEQYQVCFSAQCRGANKGDKLQRNALMYVSHFLQVLMMAVERGEIKRTALQLYGITEDMEKHLRPHGIEALLKCGQAVIEGEKERVKQGGRPIYNPTIGMVSTHLDIFRQNYEQQKLLQKRTAEAQRPLKGLRPKIDAVISNLWNQIDNHYKNLPQAERIEACRKLGVVYYYRKGEK